MIVVRGKVRKFEGKSIVSTPGLFAWIRDVYIAYKRDIREGMKNTVTKVL